MSLIYRDNGFLRNLDGDSSSAYTFDGRVAIGNISAEDDWALTVSGNTRLQGQVLYMSSEIINLGADSNQVGGFQARTFGSQNVTLGNNTIAAGLNTQALGDQSVTLGEGTVMRTTDGLAVGRYNATSANVLFVVGSGTQGSPSDALAVLDNGTVVARTLQTSGALTVTGPLEGTLVGEVDPDGSTNGLAVYSDSRTQIYSAANVSIGFSSNTSTTVRDAFVFTPDGRLGVGTISPKANLSVLGNAAIYGDMFVHGNTVQLNANDVNISDPVLLLAANSIATGATTQDVGFVGERAGGNVAVVWSAAKSEFAMFTTSQGGTTRQFTDVNYANLHINSLSANAINVTGSAAIGGKSSFAGDVAYTGNLAVNGVTAAYLTLTQAAIPSDSYINFVPGQATDPFAYSTNATYSSSNQSLNFVAGNKQTLNLDDTSTAAVPLGSVGWSFIAALTMSSSQTGECYIKCYSSFYGQTNQLFVSRQFTNVLNFYMYDASNRKASVAATIQVPTSECTIAATFDPLTDPADRGILTLYFNGAQVAQTNLNQNADAGCTMTDVNWDSLIFGGVSSPRSNLDTGYYQGALYHCQLYNRALTATEVATITGLWLNPPVHDILDSDVITIDTMGITSVKRPAHFYSDLTANSGLVVANTANVGALLVQQDGVVQGNLTTLGQTGLVGNVFMSNNVTVGINANVQNALNVGNVVTTGSDVFVGNSVVVPNTTTTFDLLVSNGVNVTGYGNVNINGPVNIYNNNLTVSHIDAVSLEVGSTAQFDSGINVTYGGATIQIGGANIQGDVSISPDQYTPGSLAVSGDAMFSQDAYVAGNLTSNISAYISGDATVGGNMFVGQTLSVLGNTVLVGTANVIGDTSFSSNVSVQANHTVGQVASILGPLSVLGIATVNNTLNVSNNTLLGGNLAVVGNATIVQSANIHNNLAVGNTVTLQGPLTVSGASTLNNILNVSGNTTLAQNATVQNNLLVGNSENITGSLLVGQAANVWGPFSVSGAAVVNNTFTVSNGTLLNANLTVVGNTYLQKNANIASNLTVGGGTTLSGALTVAQAATVQGALVANGATTVNNTLTVSNATLLNGNLAVAGNTYLQNNANVANNLTVGGGTTLSGALTVAQAATVQGALVANGATTVNNTLTVSNATLLNGNLAVAGNTYLQNNANVANNLTVGGGSALNGALTVAQAATVQGVLVVNGATTVNNTLTVSNATLLNGNLAVAGNTYLQNNANVANNLTVGGGSALNGALTVAQAATVQGVLVVNGATTVNNTLTVSNATLLNGNLAVAGNTYLQNNANVANNLTVGGGSALNGALTVTQAATVQGVLVVNGATTVNNTLTVSNATLLNGNLAVAGNTYAQRNVSIANNLTVSGNTTLQAVSASTVNANTLTITGNSALQAITTTNLTSTGNISGPINATTLNASGNSILQAVAATNLTTSGNSTLQAVTATNLTSTGNISGPINATTLTTSGNSTLQAVTATNLTSTGNISGPVNATTINASGASTLQVVTATSLTANGFINSNTLYVSGVDASYRSLVCMAPSSTTNSLVWGQTLATNNSVFMSYNAANNPTCQWAVYGRPAVSLDATGTLTVPGALIGSGNAAIANTLLVNSITSGTSVARFNGTGGAGSVANIDISTYTGGTSPTWRMTQVDSGNFQSTLVWQRNTGGSSSANLAPVMSFDTAGNVTFANSVYLNRLGQNSYNGVDLVAVNSSGILRLTASDNNEASIGFGGNNGSFSSTPQWICGRGSWGTQSNWGLGCSTGSGILFATTNGNVGIQNSSPQLTLDVGGVGRFYPSSSLAATVSGLITQNVVQGAADVGIGFQQYGINSYGIVQRSGYASSSNTSAGRLSFVQNLYPGNSGTEQMTILQNGNVGINTTSPAYVFDVNGPGRFSYGLYVGNGGNAFVNFIGGGGGGNPCTYLTFYQYASQTNPGVQITTIDDSNYSGHLAFLTKTPGSASNSLVERMRLTSSGNFGINTTSPAYTLDVTGTIRAYGTSLPQIILGDQTPDGPNRAICALSSTMATGTFRYITLGVSQSTNNQAEFSFYYSGSGSSSNRIGMGLYGGERMSILGNGNVGVNNTSPGYTLDVNGAARLGAMYSIGGTNPMYIGCVSAYTGSGNTFAMYQGSAGDTVINAASGQTIEFKINNAEYMRVASNGNIGISNTSPGYTLDVGGSARVTGGLLLPNQTNGTLLVGTTTNNVRSGYTIAAEFDGSSSAIPIGVYTSYNGSGVPLIQFYSPNGALGSITSGSSSVQYNTSSDYRLKDHRALYTNGLELVNSLRPTSYVWRIDNTPGVGFIAHEVQALVPDAVSGEKDEVDDKGVPQYQGVDYSKLVVYLVSAVQDLSQQVKSLQLALATK